MQLLNGRNEMAENFYVNTVERSLRASFQKLLLWAKNLQKNPRLPDQREQALGR